MSNLSHKNRVKNKSPRAAGKFWCMKCDMSLVSRGEKCKVCGCIQTKAKGKKRIYRKQERYIEDDL